MENKEVHTKWYEMHDEAPKYPVTDMKDLKPSRLVNPRVGKHHWWKMPDDFDKDAATILVGTVSYDVKNWDNPIQLLKDYYPFPWEFDYEEVTWPLLLKWLSFKDPQGLANVVHMDNPMDMPMACLKWLLEVEKANVKDWNPDYINFIESVPYVNLKIAEHQLESINKIFDMKYYNWWRRPEQRMFGPCMTAYKEWCPNHPKDPAWHAWFAAAVVVLIDLFTLTDRQKKILLDTAYMWAMFRTYSWVHDPEDNILGLAACWLCKYFKEEKLLPYKR